MKVAIAQIETLVGDFEGNLNKIIEYIEKARKEGCDIVVFPELCVLGYHPLDLLTKKGFCEKGFEFSKKVKDLSNGIVSIVGGINKDKECFYNSVFVFDNNKEMVISKHALKQEPPIYEKLYFSCPKEQDFFLKIKDKEVKICVGDDLYKLNIAGGVVINMTCDFYERERISEIKQNLLKRAKETNSTIIWVNGVGELLGRVLYGNSMVIGPDKVLYEGKSFEEDFIVLDLNKISDSSFEPLNLSWEEEVIKAIVFGFKSYIKKAGFKRAVIGLSGGIDSSLSACLARIAIGPENLVGISMPGPFSSKESLEDAKELTKRLRIEHHVIPINSLYDQVLDLFKDLFKGKPFDFTEENLQARLRAIILMTYSNKFNAIVINTGNKSEASVGYATLYGDSVGGISLIGDLYKASVYKLAEYINQKYNWIPERVLVKPPSAELRENQKDEEDLPPYKTLDSILELFLNKNLSEDEIVNKGFDREVVKEVLKRFCQSEYKRRQSPFCIKVDKTGFVKETLPLVFKL